MKILLSTEEGYPKDKTPGSKKKHSEKKYFLTFTGPDAPVKAIKALKQMHGITDDQIKEPS